MRHHIVLAAVLVAFLSAGNGQLLSQAKEPANETEWRHQRSAALKSIHSSGREKNMGIVFTGAGAAVMVASLKAGTGKDYTGYQSCNSPNIGPGGQVQPCVPVGPRTVRDFSPAVLAGGLASTVLGVILWGHGGDRLGNATLRLKRLNDQGVQKGWRVEGSAFMTEQYSVRLAYSW